MRTYEDDREIKIPNWYIKLPQCVLNFVSDAGLILNRMLTRRKKIDRTNKRNITFYL